MKFVVPYASEYGIPGIPTDVESARRYMKKRGDDNHTLLKDAPIDVLAKSVDVTNTTSSLLEVATPEFPLRVHKPRNYMGPALAVTFYFHDGPWCSGDANAENFEYRALIARGAPIINAAFGYRQVLETSWKDILLNAEFAMKRIANNTGSLDANALKGFLIGIRNRYPNIRLTGQLLIVPTTITFPDEEGIPEDWKRCLQSHVEIADALILTESLYEFYVKTLGVPADEA